VALGILRDAASDLALHAAALVGRLQPWLAATPVVFFGGMFRTPMFVQLVTAAMTQTMPSGFEVRAPAEDAVTGALRIASDLIAPQTLHPDTCLPHPPLR
jgi:N-acetylglucosamine kinase-like BadF-type ATPase